MPSPTSTKPSGSIPRTRRPSFPAPPPGWPRKTQSRPWPTSTRPSVSTRRTPTPISSGRRFGARKASSTRPSPTSPDHQARFPGAPGVRGTRHGLAAQEGIRSRDRRLHRGHPPRPEECRSLRRPVASPGAKSGRTTRPSPTSTRPSELDPENPDAYGIRGDAWADKKEFDKAIADFTRVLDARPEERLGLCQPGHRPTPSGSNTTRPSPTSTGPSRSIPAIPTP